MITLHSAKGYVSTSPRGPEESRGKAHLQLCLELVCQLAICYGVADPRPRDNADVPGHLVHYGAVEISLDGALGGGLSGWKIACQVSSKFRRDHVNFPVGNS